MNEQQKRYLTTVPTSAAGILEGAFTKTRGRANGIKAKCLQCCNYVRDEVRGCTVELCPLHPWRPFQSKADSSTSNDSTDDTFDPDLDGDAAGPANEEDDEL